MQTDDTENTQTLKISEISAGITCHAALFFHNRLKDKSIPVQVLWDAGGSRSRDFHTITHMKVARLSTQRTARHNR